MESEELIDEVDDGVPLVKPIKRIDLIGTDTYHAEIQTVRRINLQKFQAWAVVLGLIAMAVGVIWLHYRVRVIERSLATDKNKTQLNGRGLPASLSRVDAAGRAMQISERETLGIASNSPSQIDPEVKSNPKLPVSAPRIDRRRRRKTQRSRLVRTSR